MGITSVLVDAGREFGEIFAVITTALCEMSDNNHDIEYAVFTVRKV